MTSVGEAAEQWVRDGARVEARYASGDGVHAAGRVISYTDRPTVTIETDSGERVSWLAELCRRLPDLSTIASQAGLVDPGEAEHALMLGARFLAHGFTGDEIDHMIQNHYRDAANRESARDSSSPAHPGWIQVGDVVTLHFADGASIQARATARDDTLPDERRITFVPTMDTYRVVD